MKNDFEFIEMFTDIDDELIANAKPAAQKPIELRPEPRSKSYVWQRIAAAAACLAVLAAAGSVIAVKANSGQAVAPSSSGEAALSDDTNSQFNEIIESMTSSIPVESANSVKNSDVFETSDGDQSNNSGVHIPESMIDQKWTTGEEFIYEGKSYKIISCGGSGSFSNGMYSIEEWTDLKNDGVGVRREMIDGVDTLEFVAFIENRGTSPVGLLGSTGSPDKPFLFKFDVNEDLVDSHHVFDDEVFDSVALFLQPGETYYQKASFPVTEEKEYRFSMCVYFLNQRIYDESNKETISKNGGMIANRWADFSDKSVSFDNVYELFGASNLSKALEAAAEKIESESSSLSKALKDSEFGGYDDDPGFSN